MTTTWTRILTILRHGVMVVQPYQTSEKRNNLGVDEVDSLEERDNLWKLLLRLNMMGVNVCWMLTLTPRVWLV